MTVKKRPTKTDNCKVFSDLEYVILDVAIFQRISVNVPSSPNLVAYAVFDGQVQLTEDETTFKDVTVDTIHSAIRKQISRDKIRLNLLRTLKGQTFKAGE